MLVIPYESCYRIIAIDPASVYMGLSILDVDMDTRLIHIQLSKTLNSNQLMTKVLSDYYPSHGDNFIRLDLLSKMLKRYIDAWTPNAIVHEDTYCNPKLVTAFRSLTRFSHMIASLTMQYNNYLTLNVLEASRVKKMVGAKGHDKELVRRGVYQLIDGGQLQLDCDVNLDDLDEHAIDSIAIGYTHAIEFLNNLDKGNVLWG